METYHIHLVANENETMLSCSPSLDLALEIHLVTPSMGALELDLPPVDPKKYSF